MSWSRPLFSHDRGSSVFSSLLKSEAPRLYVFPFISELSKPCVVLVKLAWVSKWPRKHKCIIEIRLCAYAKLCGNSFTCYLEQKTPLYEVLI